MKTEALSTDQHPAPIRKRKTNALHMIHKWSIEHPYFIAAFYIAMVFLAYINVSRNMPRRFAPYVESPMVGIVTMMPGLSAREMELYVSGPVEQQMVHIKNLKYIRSNSQNGFSIVTLEFPYGTDMQRTLTDVQALMNVTQSSLPATGANMKPSWVVLVDPLNLPVLTLSVRGDPDKGWNMIRVREFADNTVVNRLKAVQSVYSVVPFGGFKRQLQVTVDRDKLAARRLSILSVRDAIDRSNVARSAGTITNGPHETIVRTDSHALSAEDVLNYPVTATPPSSVARTGRSDGNSTALGSAGAGASAMGSRSAGMGQSSAYGYGNGPKATSSNRVTFVRDVAHVEDAAWERRSGYHYLQHQPGSDAVVVPSIEVSVIQNPGASSSQVAPAILAIVGQLERDNPGIHFETSYDNSHFVDVLFSNVWEELAVAVLLTGLAVLLFLGEWRATLIAMVTLPTSLAMAVLMMAPFGMSFNSGTLVGLLLSIGRLVDDSIIDIHAVERHIRMGKTPKHATIDGIAEVRVAVIASTLMIVLALTPLLFSGGITGLMFRELVWPLIFGLIASMLVSFTLTALLCATLLRAENIRAQDKKHFLLRALYVVLDPCQDALQRLEVGYGHTVRWLLKHRFVNFMRVLATLVIGFTFYYFIGSEMMPLADVGQASGILEMAPGTSYESTEKAVEKLEKIVANYPEVRKASIEIGAESMFESFSPSYTGYQMPQVNGASIMLTLCDKDDRKRSIFQIMDGIQRDATSTIPGIRRLQIKEMGSDVMATSAAPVHINIYGPDLQELDRLGEAALFAAKKMPEMVQPATTWSDTVPEFRIKVDPQRAQEAGLTSDSVSEQAYYALSGGLTSEYYRLDNLRLDTIQLRYDRRDRATLSDLENMFLTAPDGNQLQLKTVATVNNELSPTVIEHDGLKRVIGVTGYYRADSLPSMDVVMNLTSNIYGGNARLGIKPVNFPPGYGMEVRGDMKEMMDAFRRMIAGLTLALALMYLVLVVQFRGFLQPLQMIASLPLELAGVFIALWLAHQAFSTVSILGIIVLTGMDITTAVLLIDRIMKVRDSGTPRDEAIALACPERLRPILMTSGITLITMLPVALAPKTGLDAYQPLATTIVGGLIVGTTLSLFDIPIMHTYLDDLMVWLNRTFFNRTYQWRKAEEESDELDS